MGTHGAQRAHGARIRAETLDVAPPSRLASAAMRTQNSTDVPAAGCHRRPDARVRLARLSVAALLLVAAPALATPPPCSLLDVRVSAEAPIVKRGPMRNAFGRYLAGQHAAAAKSFDKAAAEIAGKVEKLFHPAPDEKVANEKIRRFLGDHVTGKNPVLRVQGDDFVYVPTVLLAWAESRCKTGDAKGASALLDRLAGDPDDRVAPTRAIVALEEGAADRALAILGDAGKADPWLIRAVRALALAQAGRVDEAWASLDEAREQCVGEAACGKVEQVRGQLLELGRERALPPAPGSRSMQGPVPGDGSTPRGGTTEQAPAADDDAEQAPAADDDAEPAPAADDDAEPAPPAPRGEPTPDTGGTP